ncbi:MAG: DUF4007 family protein [Candidatus Brocadia sp.]|nr:DUF4007 family protein [Candidatus Brocadia sp.]
MKAQTIYKISGHETFPLRYTWLPKAVKVLKDNPKIFSDEDDAMVSLGEICLMRSKAFTGTIRGIAEPEYPCSHEKKTSCSPKKPVNIRLLRIL